MVHNRTEPEQLYLESLVASLTGWDDPEARLERAFRLDEFLLFGQPMVPIGRKADLPPRVEVLIRLGEEERHLTPPGTFIPIIEHFKMMPVLDRWVIEHVAKWWRAKAGPPKAMPSINLSGETLSEASFPVFVERQLHAAGIPGGAVHFELDVTEIVTGPPQLARSAERLRSLGCRFAISDFGRDTLSFDALRAVAATTVKMDGMIVKEIHRDPVALGTIRSIHGACQKVGIHTVAEFVELPETLRLLRELGVDYAQGYGVARPEPLTGR